MAHGTRTRDDAERTSDKNQDPTGIPIYSTSHGYSLNDGWAWGWPGVELEAGRTPVGCHM